MRAYKSPHRFPEHFVNPHFQKCYKNHFRLMPYHMPVVKNRPILPPVTFDPYPQGTKIMYRRFWRRPGWEKRENFLRKMDYLKHLPEMVACYEGLL